MKVPDIINNAILLEEFYKQVILEILSSNQESLELIIYISVINTEIETNIHRKSIETSCKLPNIENAFNELLETKILKNKEGEVDIYEFSFPQIQVVLETQTDKSSHKYALQYYEAKAKKLKGTLQDDIEVLFHKAKLNPTEELVNEFLTIANTIDQFDFSHRRLIDIGEQLMVLEDKYKAPILFVLGNILSIIGTPEVAEKIYLNAVEIFKNLAKNYYRIYLPYVAAIQKNLGTLYIDLKRFEEAEKIYNDALGSYRELQSQYYDVHSPDFDLKEYNVIEKSYIDDIKEYKKLLKKHYDVYLPEEPSVVSDFGNVCVDLDLLEDIQDGSIDSLDNYKKLAKMCYDMYLVDIAKTQSNLGMIYSEQMKFEEAEKMHLEALKIKKKIAENFPDQVLPELVLTLLDLGDLYASLNRFEEAEPMFNEALRISKRLVEKNPEVYMYNMAILQNSLGLIYTQLQNYELAEQIYLDALKIFKNYAKEDPKTYSFNVGNVQNNLGNLYLIRRNLEKAQRYLNKAFKNDPTNIEIIYNIACLESLKNNQVKALELLTKVIEFDKRYLERAMMDDRFDDIRDLNEFKELISE